MMGVCPYIAHTGEMQEFYKRGAPAIEAPHEESKRMRSKLAFSFFALSGLAILPTASFAAKQNDTARQEDRDRDRGDKVREVTGCLQKNGDDYELMADNGSTWELKSDRANLRDYVGQTVKVTGTVNHQKMHDAKEKAKEKTQDNPSEHGHLTVTDVRPLSRSCSR
jgi:hypothetical protein